MYLVSDESHKPVSTFDDIDKAISYITSWTQRSARFVELQSIPGTTIFRVVSLDDKHVLGYIIEGIIHNPSFTSY